MEHPVSSTVHCINPKCPKPHGQPWGNRFCQSCGAPLQLNDRYIPLNSLGSGGFSRLYTIWDLKTQSEKVLKVLVQPDPKALELFEQEARVLASLQHSGVPRVVPDGYFFLRRRNRNPLQLPCLIMEKINGLTLEEILAEYPQGCPEELVMLWLHQALDILRELHKRGIVHRDLKPSNLMLRLPHPQTLDYSQLADSPLVMIDFGGAKQIGTLVHSDRETTPRSHTRLVSPGYSPPEQIVGAAITPATDFYALGRTCIHLLTGLFPAELEDPMTGKLQWQHRVAVTPGFAELLDCMVENDVNERPQNADDIQTYLFRIARMKRHPRRMMSFPQLFLDVIKTALIEVDRIIWGGLKLVGRSLLAISQAITETLWQIGLASSGGMLGAGLGLILAYQSPLGQILGDLLKPSLPLLFSHLSNNLGAEIIVLSLAGLGTGLGLTDGAGFQQRRHYKWAGVMGVFGYLTGGLLWRIISTISLVPGFGNLAMARWFCIGMTTVILTWGLDWKSHRSVYAIVSASATSAIFWGLANLNILPIYLLQFPQVSLIAEWVQFRYAITFVGLLGCTIALSLAVIHYTIIPILRLIGWK
ncbi:MAG: serine/threonine-protein kinase [Limnospira sp. PMC 1291.21]|uniref:non-specific serine/threonine protein kinase n=2 Tax=Limnospira TaxID=2596745 RepID=B5VU13_LIMMA|nr:MULTISPECIES: serine/threonine-protein kinase [Limnospira]EKD10485.1 serine/threonine protein kinase [Arthrospira platensis C1]MDC0836435.1 serine/threonine-protein kinase [Limnoraphis robusta]MDY7052414.1 serine/threonine-protein kinase [Limnospira fusiformis LS22]QJB29669.1 serine/threonine protein kinase [Limnospira fusiformis SAG 85.79]EDZ97029.1 serine/threonine protein kinase [Limnospira maxima CS-328]